MVFDGNNNRLVEAQEVLPKDVCSTTMDISYLCEGARKGMM